MRHAGLITILLACSTAAVADKGDAAIGLEYQYIRTGVFDSSIGDLDIGNTDAHVLMFSGHYAITEKLTVFGSLPWIQKKHTGALPHNANIDFQNYQPPDLRVVDDGSYHGGLQDLYAGISYELRDERLDLSAFVSYGTPVDDYPFYGHAAIGRNLWHVPVGLNWSFTPYFDDWYLEGGIAYVFTEKTLGVDVSHWLFNVKAGYFVSRKFVPHVFVSIKHGTKGLSFPDDFSFPNLDTEEFYYHDRTIKHNWTNAGLGLDYIASDKYVISGTWFTMVDPDQVNEVEYAWTLGFRRHFGGE